MSQTNNSIHTFEEAKKLMTQAVLSYKPSESITRLEFKIKPIDQMVWLAAQTITPKVFGANQDDSAAIAGVGEAIAVRGKGKVDYAAIFAQLRRYLTPRYPYLQWYGGFCFDPTTNDSAWKSFGSWGFVLPRFELARDKNKMIFCCNLLGVINSKKVLKEIESLTLKNVEKKISLKVLRRVDAPQFGAWQRSVKTVLNNIDKGICQKIVLARKTDLFFKQVLKPWAILKTLKKVTPNSYHFAFEFGDAVFLGASPERLYKRHGRAIMSEALAGTKPAKSSAKALLNSAKDRHEHQLVVDDIAQTLHPLCEQLIFNPTPTIKTLSNGHHLDTEFKGHLKGGVTDADVLQSLHPTPALGGVPKNVALKSIRAIEPFGRGWYAGPLGYVGLDWAEFVVGIRSGLIKGKKLSVFAGAGIVKGSDPQEEWQEIENKISNFIKIIK